MIEEDVKQTRCTTCDAEHAYKGARVPKRRKKETPAALYKEVLAGMPDVEEAPLLAAALPAVAVAAALPSVPAAVLPVQADAPSSVPPSKNRRRRRLRFRSDRDADRSASSSAALRSQRQVQTRSMPPDEAPVVDGPVHRAADSRNASACRRAEGCPSRTGLHRPAMYRRAEPATAASAATAIACACAAAAAAAAMAAATAERQRHGHGNGDANGWSPRSRATAVRSGAPADGPAGGAARLPQRQR